MLKPDYNERNDEQLHVLPLYRLLDNAGNIAPTNFVMPPHFWKSTIQGRKELIEGKGRYVLPKPVNKEKDDNVVDKQVDNKPVNKDCPQQGYPQSFISPTICDQNTIPSFFSKQWDPFNGFPMKPNGSVPHFTDEFSISCFRQQFDVMKNNSDANHEQHTTVQNGSFNKFGNVVSDTNSSIKSDAGKIFKEETKETNHTRKTKEYISQPTVITREMGGVAIALGHGSFLVECARKELHATTPLKNPMRSNPSRVSIVFYQHKTLNKEKHGYLEYQEKMRIKKEEQMLTQAENKRSGSFNDLPDTVTFSDTFLSSCESTPEKVNPLVALCKQETFENSRILHGNDSKKNYSGQHQGDWMSTQAKKISNFSITDLLNNDTKRENNNSVNCHIKAKQSLPTFSIFSKQLKQNSTSCENWVQVKKEEQNLTVRKREFPENSNNLLCPSKPLIKHLKMEDNIEVTSNLQHDDNKPQFSVADLTKITVHTQEKHADKSIMQHDSNVQDHPSILRINSQNPGSYDKFSQQTNDFTALSSPGRTSYHNNPSIPRDKNSMSLTGRISQQAPCATSSGIPPIDSMAQQTLTDSSSLVSSSASAQHNVDSHVTSCKINSFPIPHMKGISEQPNSNLSAMSHLGNISVQPDTTPSTYALNHASAHHYQNNQAISCNINSSAMSPMKGVSLKVPAASPMRNLEGIPQRSNINHSTLGSNSGLAAHQATLLDTHATFYAQRVWQDQSQAYSNTLRSAPTAISGNEKNHYFQNQHPHQNQQYLHGNQNSIHHLSQMVKGEHRLPYNDQQMMHGMYIEEQKQIQNKEQNTYNQLMQHRDDRVEHMQHPYDRHIPQAHLYSMKHQQNTQNGPAQHLHGGDYSHQQPQMPYQHVDFPKYQRDEFSYHHKEARTPTTTDQEYQAHMYNALMKKCAQ